MVELFVKQMRDEFETSMAEELSYLGFQTKKLNEGVFVFYFKCHTLLFKTNVLKSLQRKEVGQERFVLKC